MVGLLGGISAGLGLIGGAAKFFEGRRMQRDAQRAIDAFEWQDLQNPYEGLQVSTLGADLQREEASRLASGQVDALRGAGTRGLVGGLGRVQAQNQLLNRQIAANLDEQQRRLDFATAQQDVVNQNMIEQRLANELAGYGQQMNVGMGMKYGGISDAINSIGMGNTSIGNIDSTGGRTGNTPVLSTQQLAGVPLNSQGAIPMSTGLEGMGGFITPPLNTGLSQGASPMSTGILGMGNLAIPPIG